jgi:hypothetical protein
MLATDPVGKLYKNPLGDQRFNKDHLPLPNNSLARQFALLNEHAMSLPKKWCFSHRRKVTRSATLENSKIENIDI